MSRYNHWFWDSFLVNWIEGRAVVLSSHIWRKRYSCKKSYKIGQNNLEVG